LHVIHSFVPVLCWADGLSGTLQRMELAGYATVVDNNDVYTRRVKSLSHLQYILDNCTKLLVSAVRYICWQTDDGTFPATLHGS